MKQKFKLTKGIIKIETVLYRLLICKSQFGLPVQSRTLHLRQAHFPPPVGRAT
jgi:hypothetical protein